MIFTGEPGLLVRVMERNKVAKYLKFDENGEYETDNPGLIKRMSVNFQIKGTSKEEIAVKKTYKCKKCDFVGENMGILLAHYRNEHKEDKDEI